MTPVELCVHNNADLYDAIFRAHSFTWTRDDRLWVTRDEPPPYYSNSLLLDPDSAPELLTVMHELRDTTARTIFCKDGYRAIFGARHGLQLLFPATWIVHHPGKGVERAPWHIVRTPGQLRAWEDAWALPSPPETRVFPASVLNDPALIFFGQEAGDRYLAGCLVNMSDGCVGLSNVFGNSYADALLCALSLAEGRPVVGYELGESLTAAKSAGFKAVGSLNVWTLPAA